MVGFKIIILIWLNLLNEESCHIYEESLLQNFENC